MEEWKEMAAAGKQLITSPLQNRARLTKWLRSGAKSTPVLLISGVMAVKSASTTRLQIIAMKKPHVSDSHYITHDPCIPFPHNHDNNYHHHTYSFTVFS